MKKITLSLFFILNYIVMNAQVLPKEVNLTELGLRFELPEGWTGQLQEEYILLGHDTLPGIMFIFENETETAADLKTLAMEGIVEDGLWLKSKGEFKIVDEKRVEGIYEGTYNGTNAMGFGIGLINDLGSGMSILILTETKMFAEQHAIEADKLARTVRFSAPVENERVSFWKNKLMGRQYKYLDSSYDEDHIGGTTSSSETVILNFCDNGNFKYYYNQMNTMDTVDASAHQGLRDRNTGTYEIYSQNEAIWVDLNFNNGKIITYELTTDSAKQKTLFNGTRYYNTGEYANCE